MLRRWHVPLVAVALGLVGLLGLLGFLQYRWLGQVSEAERSRMQSTLATGAAAFAREIDGELTRAYLLFQPDPLDDGEDSAARFASRYERWQATSRFPKLIEAFYAFSPGETPRLEQFDPETRTFATVAWPDSMRDWREHLAASSNALREVPERGDTLVIRRIAPPVWASVPAIVVPSPVLRLAERLLENGRRVPPQFSYSILTIDREYVSRELLPALATQHLVAPGGPDFRIAVRSRAEGGRLWYQSSADFNPALDSPADARTDLFSVRTQDFGRVSAEVRHFAKIASALRVRTSDAVARRGTPPAGARTIVIERSTPPEQAPVLPIAGAAPPSPAAPSWQLIVTHQSGSLEQAVNAVRRRNLILSASVLGVLGASMGLLMVSARRAQRLAKQQMDFVATVSHELRTPLAVIQSAADNLADGVIDDQARIKTYGELVRAEGRRLTELVDQILELSGMASGQRRFAAETIRLGLLLREVVNASATLVSDAGIEVVLDLPDDLPPVLGDEVLLRRVFQNLVSNAIKYGAQGRWIGVEARSDAGDIEVTICDRGIGIEPSEQARIFEPFHRAPAVVAAQIQGAGLGLSLVHRIVLAHRGKVTVRSTPGRGAAFIVRLPAAAAAQQSTVVQAALDARQVASAQSLKPEAQSLAPEGRQ